MTDEPDTNTSIAHVVYFLQAISFFNGITYLAAIIVNYVKLDDVRGSWLESHFRWQMRTFWFSLLWLAIGVVTVFIFVGYIILVANSVWFLYRIIKGWLNLKDGISMYAA